MTVMSAVRAIGRFISRSEPPEPPVRSPFRVLVVDDEPIVRAFVERVLTDAGYTVAAASDGPAGLRALGELPPFDLIVSDVRMPGMSGPEFIDRVRTDRPGVTVLYLTGYNDELFKERIALSDNEAFLDKPSTVKGLLEAVALLLRSSLQGARTS